MEGPLTTSYDLSAVKTAFPMCQDGIYAKWRCTKISLDKKEIKDPSVGIIENNFGSVLKMEFDLVDPAPDTDGGQILPGKPGAKFFDTTNLYSKTDAKDAGWFAKKICGRIDALLGTADADNKKGKQPRPPINLASPTLDADLSALLLGKELIAKMRVTTFEGQTRSEFGQLWFPADLNVGGAK